MRATSYATLPGPQFGVARAVKKALTLKRAKELAGSLGFPTKMPGTSYGIPTHACGVGGKLRTVKGSTCENCYADPEIRTSNYSYPSVRIAQERRLASLHNVEWSAAMVYMLRKAHGLIDGKVSKDIKPGGQFWHRWHDSGDTQGVWHLMKICEVARATPEIRHWLPMREAGHYLKFLAMGLEIPSNLVVRVSAPMVDGPASERFPHTSTVHRDNVPPADEICPAPLQDNECGPCRKCWDPTVSNTSYHVH